jgi:hypothetical protein
MRRALRPLLPALAATYPGWDWSRIDDMPEAEIAEFRADLEARTRASERR